MDDNLRQRLGRLDPVDPAMPTDTASSPRVRALLEEIMTTPTDELPISPPAPTPPSKRRIGILAGVAAAVIAIAIGIAVANDGGGTKQSRLALSLPDAAPGRTCIQFSTDQLAQASDAFAGTVTALTGTGVTLTVDHWYKASGVKADQVTVATGTSLPFLGVQFTKGGKYLVSATDGHVNGCGFSGEATAELQAAFVSAFPG